MIMDAFLAMMEETLSQMGIVDVKIMIINQLLSG